MVTLQPTISQRCRGLLFILHATVFTVVLGVATFPYGILLPHFWFGLAMWWLIVDGFVHRVELDASGVRVIRLGRSTCYEWRQIRFVDVGLRPGSLRGGARTFGRRSVVVPMLQLADGRDITLWPLSAAFNGRHLPRVESDLDSTAVSHAERIREFGSHHNRVLLT